VIKIAVSGKIIGETMKTMDQISHKASRYYRQFSHFGPLGCLNSINLKIAKMFQSRKVRGRPYFIQVEVSTICNFRCAMCWLGLLHLDEVKQKFEGRMKQMSFEEFKMIFKDIKYTESVLLQGTGEPFMNPEIFEMIHYLRDRKFPHTGIISNGSKITREMSREIIDTRISEICVSFDGAKAETYEEIRKGANFEEVLGNLKGLVEEKRLRGVDYPELALIFVALKTNIAELNDFVKMAHEIGVDRIDIKEFSMPHPTLTHLCLENEDRRYLIEALETSKRLGIRAVFYHSLLPEIMPTTRQKCYWPWTSLCVTIDGHVTPCWYNLFPDDTSMGNIFEDDFQSIWNGAKYQDFRTRLSTGIPEKPNICRMCPGYQ